MARKTLADISPVPLEKLQAVAALAPPEEEKDPGPIPGRGGKSAPGGKGRGSLGSLDLKKYLTHYGVAYNVKKEKNRTLYRLEQCLFDSAHGKNEASIVQDTTGLITYNCFHDHCNHRWSEARPRISGEDNLAQFCEGYDPSLRRSQQPAGPASPYDTGKASPAAPSQVPPPSSVDPSDFFEGRSFVPQFLAKYLESHFKPLVYGAGEFFQYDPAGLWRMVEDDQVGQVAERVLDKQAKSARIEDAIKLLRKRCFVTADKFKHDPGFVNVKNGMLDLETLDLVPHDPKYMSRIQLPVEYDPKARAPLWINKLFEICSEDRDKMRTLQTFFGYCLLPDCRFQRYLFLIGGGANGKAVVVDTLIHLLGQENVCSLPLQLMSQRFLIGQLKDKLINVSGEVQTNQPVDTSIFKDAVTGGLLMADAKHGKPFTFFPIAKHIFSMNDIPKITDKSYGFQRRPIMLAFRERFEGDRCDPQLTEKLKVEAYGIFRWMLDGLKWALEHNSLYVPETVKRDTAQFVKSTNPVLLFVEECCILDKDVKVKPRDLYQEYKSWCEEGGNRPLSRNRFYDQILINFLEVSKKMVGDNRQRFYMGMGLRDSVS